MPDEPFRIAPDEIEFSLAGVTLFLKTRPELFSPRRVDAGTEAMLKCVSFDSDDRVLDLGCGCGVVGILAAKLIGASRVFLVDSDPLAVECSKQNCIRNGVPETTVLLSDGFADFRETGLTKILSNPPYHTDFSVARRFILKGFNRLVIGGQMWFVTKREAWYRNRLAAVFGGVQVRQVDGYCVMMAEKRRNSYARRIR
ncbi:MAG: methyltransferase [Planctomycetaceae bacterium]